MIELALQTDEEKRLRALALVRPREVCALLAVSARTLDRLIASGRLPVVWVGGGRRVPLSGIEALIAEGFTKH